MKILSVLRQIVAALTLLGCILVGIFLMEKTLDSVNTVEWFILGLLVYIANKLDRREEEDEEEE